LRTDFQAGKTLYRVDGFEVERVAHRERESAFGDRDREDAGLAQEARRKAFELRRRGGRADLSNGQAQLFRKRSEQIALGNKTHIDEDLAEFLAAALALQFECAIEVFRGDQATFDEQLTERS